MESKGEVRYLFIPSKTTLVPEFGADDLPLDRTVTLVHAFAVKHSDDDSGVSRIWL